MTSGLALAALGLFCLKVEPFEGSLADLSFDLGFLPISPDGDSDVIVIERDEASRDELHQGNGDWDRSLYARLVDTLAADQAELVVFDLTLANEIPGKEKEDDRLARAIQRCGRVILVSESGPIPNMEEGEARTPPLARFVESAKAVGHASIDGLRDGNRVPRELDCGEHWPSLGWAAAKHAGAPVTSNEMSRGIRRWLNYQIAPERLQWVRFADALLRQPPGVFKHKYVFIGASAGQVGTQGDKKDEFGTPRTRWGGGTCAGVRIHALTFLNLLRGNWLVRMPLGLEMLLCLGVGLALGFGVPRLKPSAALLMLGVLAVLVFVGAVALVVHYRVWFSWLTIVGVQAPGAMVWSLLHHTGRLEREKEAATVRLAREQEVVDRLLGGSGAPAMQGQMPSPEAVGGSASAKPPAQVLFEASPTKPELPDAVPGSKVPAPGIWVPPSVPDHTLIRCVGGGSYGQVWLAQDAIGSYHAVKFVCRDTFSTDAPYEREFKGIQRFTPISRAHANLVHILHVGRNPAGRYFYYMMELGDDEENGQKIFPADYRPMTLAGLIRRKGRLAVPECVRIALPLASALRFLHEHRLIHRDIKPSNILFVDGAPKLADVGLVTEIESKQGGTTYVGTEGYIAPEGPGSPRADVFSLGKVLYEAATGYDRGQYPNLPTTIIAGADPTMVRLNEIILRACEVDTGRRYQSAAELEHDLDGLARLLGIGDKR